MEDSAIREGFENLMPGSRYEPLYQSALCRQKADWLIGINATRLFSVLYHKTLNVGRVQTPTLAMLAERDGKIMLFQKEKYYHVRLGLPGLEAVSERISEETKAISIQTACQNMQAVCVSSDKEKKTVKPPKLYDLTTLQREANRIYGFTAKQTLDYAQGLYEKKLLTYPRTDSRYLTGDMAETVSVVAHLAARQAPFSSCTDFSLWWRRSSRIRTYPTTMPSSPQWNWKNRILPCCLPERGTSFFWSAASCCVHWQSHISMKAFQRYFPVGRKLSPQRERQSCVRDGKK